MQDFNRMTPPPGGRPAVGPNRREWLRWGGLSSLGLSLPMLLQQRAAANSGDRTNGKAKHCIVLFLLGGAPQQSTFDPKPDAPAEVRGAYGPIATAVPGVHFAEILPQLAKQMDKLAVLRAVATNDNAHSSSGYYMLTGVPHAPMNVENANPGPPNDWPTMGAVVRRLRGDSGGLPASVRLPMHIFNTDSSVWPGQDAGFLGRNSDPWLFRCEPAAPEFRIPEFTLQTDVPLHRLTQRRELLQRLDRQIAGQSESTAGQFSPLMAQAFDLLSSPQARAAFDLNREPVALRDRYGRSQFGQSCLLARRLIEAGVSLVHVNWFRGPDEPSDAPCWDSHANETARLKSALAPPLDQGMSALLDDLHQRGLLDETLVVCLTEFGRTPRFNGRGGRDHWGHVFSVAMAGGGVRGGQVIGASDKQGAYPSQGRVAPQDITASMLHALGYPAHTEIHDSQGRPLAVSKGQVIRNLFS